MGTFKLGKMTLKSLFGKPETIMYPVQQPPRPAGLRGHVVIDIELCILCGICSKRCPADAISVDKAAQTWSINHFQCVQCEACVRDCPKACLSMDVESAPAAATKGLTVVAKPAPEPEPEPAPEPEAAPEAAPESE